MPEYLFKVVSQSSGEIYEVRIGRVGDALTARCTCTAAENGMACKHRTRILEGSTVDIKSPNKHEVALAKALVPGSNYEEAKRAIASIEEQQKALAKQLTQAKKALARIMAGA